MLKMKWLESFRLNIHKTPMLEPGACARLHPFWRLCKLSCPGCWAKCLSGHTPRHKEMKSIIDRSIKHGTLSLRSMKLWESLVITPVDVLSFLFEGGDWLPLAEKYLASIPECHKRAMWFYRIKADVQMTRAERVRHVQEKTLSRPKIEPPPPPPPKEKPLDQWYDGHYHFFGDLCDTPS